MTAREPGDWERAHRTFVARFSEIFVKKILVAPTDRTSDVGKLTT